MATASYLNADLSFNRAGIMSAAHAEARASVAAAAKRGKVRRYKIALRDALTFAWISARAQRDCAIRDAELAAIPASHAAILAERTAALMIDSTVTMLAEVARIDARALVMGVSL